MNEQEKNVTNGTEGTQQQEPNQATQQQPAATQQTQQQEPEKKKGGFGAFVKAHWKGITGGVVAAFVTGASAVMAYRKGKAAGGYVPPQQEDYDLNPNND